MGGCFFSFDNLLETNQGFSRFSVRVVIFFKDSGLSISNRAIFYDRVCVRLILEFLKKASRNIRRLRCVNVSFSCVDFLGRAPLRVQGGKKEKIKKKGGY